MSQYIRMPVSGICSFLVLIYKDVFVASLNYARERVIRTDICVSAF